MKDLLALLTVLPLAPPATLHAANLPKPQTQPNLVLILADETGYGDPGCYKPHS